MIGSLFYFVALLATAELEIAQVCDAALLQPEEQLVISENNSKSAALPIAITNSIEPSMLSYKHWTGTYSPEKFVVYVNEKELPFGGVYVHGGAHEPLVVRFDYSFMNGMRKGSKKIFYECDKNITTAKITFSWLDDWKVIIDNATPIKEETV